MTNVLLSRAKIYAHRWQGKKIVFANGCFDIIHAGHIKLLREAKSLGDFLVVGINSDESVERIKGRNRPINNLRDRILVLESIKYVDTVYPFEEDTPLEIIMKIKPDVLVKGGDWIEENIIGADFVKSNGGKIKIIDYETNKSTTEIIRRCCI